MRGVSFQQTIAVPCVGLRRIRRIGRPCILCIMGCDEKAALMAAYQKAAVVYSEAVADLSRAVGSVLHAEYELIQRKVAAARKLSEKARNRLHDHERQHNC